MLLIIFSHLMSWSMSGSVKESLKTPFGSERQRKVKNVTIETIPKKKIRLLAHFNE